MSEPLPSPKAPAQDWSWKHLQGVVDPLLLQAPRLHWEKISWRTTRYLARTAMGAPWINQLAFAAAVLSSYTKLDPATVYRYIHVLHRGWRIIFRTYNIASFENWQPEKYLPLYLEDTSLTDTLSTRQTFLKVYYQTANHTQEYLNTFVNLDEEEQRIDLEEEYQRYQQWAFPRLYPELFRSISRQSEVKDIQRLQRKHETDAVTPHFPQIRYETHLRWNELWRLYAEYQKLKAKVKAGEQTPPVAFWIEEPRWGRLHFVLWDRPSFATKQAQYYQPGTLKDFQLRRRAYSPEQNHCFLEFVGREAPQGSPAVPDPDELFWFGDLLKEEVLGKDAHRGSAQELARKQTYLRSWGYGREAKKEEIIRPFDSHARGLLSWPRGRANFLDSAQRRTHKIFVPIESLFAAATFGLAALEVFTTTGARMNELLQISLTPECLHSIRVDGEERLILRLIPKGEEKPADYFVGNEIQDVFLKVVQLLWAHYHLPEGTPLPAVPFDRLHGRAHLFPARSYLFQFEGSHLRDLAITASIRFLLHGMVFQTADEQTIPISSHLLRHAFATHLSQVEKVPLDIIAMILHHKNLQTTAYYAAPTQRQVASQRVSFLDRIATPLGDFNEFVARAPLELREQLELAEQRVGTLMRVPGGQCTCHALCPIGLACDGCIYKVVDPVYREELLERRKYASQGLELAEKQRLGPDIVRYRSWLQRIDLELQEMHLIEEYRKDEQRQPLIQIQRRPKQSASLASSSLRGQTAADGAVGPVYRRSTGSKG